MNPARLVNHARQAALVLLLLVGCLATPVAAQYDELSVTYFYVGPGNCVLVQCPTSTGTEFVNLIVDCGSHRARERASVLESANLVLGEGFDGPETIVTNVLLTHPDKDHYNYVRYMTPLLKFPDGITGGSVTFHESNMGTVYAGGVFADYSREGLLYDAIQFSANGTIYGQKQPYETGPIALPGSNKSRTYERTRYNRPLQDVRSLQFNAAATPTDLGLCGDAEVFLLSANSSPGSIQTKTNAQSLVLALRYAGQVFIFPGDATNESAHGNGLQTALDSWARVHGKTLAGYTAYDSDLQVDFMMAPHHGAKSEGSDWDGWARVTQPEVVIYSADPELTTYHHPSESAFNAYRPYLKSTTSSVPFTYWRESGGSYTRIDDEVDNAAIGLSNSGDFVVNVTSAGDVSIECSGDRAEAWGCGTALLTSVDPEDDEPAHRRLMEVSESVDESFESPTLTSGTTSPGTAPAGWLHCQGGGMAHEGGITGDTPWGSQVLSVDSSAGTARDVLQGVVAEHTYLVTADLKAEGSSGTATVHLELVALDFDESYDVCDTSFTNVVASSSKTLTRGAGWETIDFFFTPDIDHIEMSKDLALRVRRSDSNASTATVYVDNVRAVETRTLDESFESPVVDGYEQESLPVSGWIGCNNSLDHGLSNEEEEDVFATVHGDQVYELRGADSGITTLEGLIGALTDGQTYNISFEAKTNSRFSGAEYYVELVAFTNAETDAARVDCVNRPGTVLTYVEGYVSPSDGWTTVTFDYVPLAGDAELADDVGLRIVNEWGDPILYDNVRLTVNRGSTGSIQVTQTGAATVNAIANTFTLTSNFASGSSDKLIVTVSGERDRNDVNTSIGGVTYGGVAMTEAVQAKNYDEGPAAIYYLDDPPASGAIVVTTNGKFNGVHGSWMSVNGVEAGITGSGSNSGGNAVSYIGSGLVVVAFHTDDTTPEQTPTADAPLTQLLSSNANFSMGAAGYDLKGSEIITYTFSGGGAGPVTVGAMFK